MKVINQTYYLPIYIVVIDITSKVLLIAFFYDIYKKLIEMKFHKEIHCLYYIYWAAQILIFVGLCMLIYFAVIEQKDKTALYIFGGSLTVDAIIAFTLTVLAVKFESYPICTKELRNDKKDDATQPLLEIPNESKDEIETGPGINDDHGQDHSPGHKESDSVKGKSSQSQEIETDINDDHGQSRITSLSQPSSTTEKTNCQQRQDGETNFKVIPSPVSLCFRLCNKEDTCTFKFDRCCCYKKHSKKCFFEHFCTAVTQGISIFSFLAFISYLSQAFPAIAISYYLKPTDSLIILGIFELAIIILLLEVALLLFLINRCTWFCYINKYKELPKEACDVEAGEFHSNTAEEINNAVHIKYLVYKDSSDQKTNLKLKFSYCSLIFVIAILQKLLQ